ncbi:MGMT family protein [Armatimonas rosea]|uniref:Methylated-DNA-protein-cysteine methyltransferase-like protein n=1 Tax=Armatimonas rosea TaxID=685828 RepID=A0A7W9SUM6_ARMRO|nr:MGMT family protein [Armatimonas rosea]MBB6052986.1 methylated-DNA-protein-cysteine methyltransferase-like protein [Armatimonas rosea]
MDEFEAIYALVRTIPAGCVLSYGEVGDRVGARPRTVGRAMAHSAEEDQVPWHRVVGSDGTLRVARHSPVLAAEQRRRLEKEGIVFDSRGRVPISFFW